MEEGKGTHEEKLRELLGHGGRDKAKHFAGSGVFLFGSFRVTTHASVQIRRNLEIPGGPGITNNGQTSVWTSRRQGALGPWGETRAHSWARVYGGMGKRRKKVVPACDPGRATGKSDAKSLDIATWHEEEFVQKTESDCDGSGGKESTTSSRAISSDGRSCTAREIVAHGHGEVEEQMDSEEAGGEGVGEAESPRTLYTR